MGGVLEVATNVGYAAKFGTNGSGDNNFANPSQIARDSSGNIYIADTGNNRVKKHQADGTYVTSITGLTNVAGVCVDSSDNVYVHFQAVPSLRKYNASLVLQWSSWASSSVEHIATDGTWIYAVTGSQSLEKLACSTGIDDAFGWAVYGLGSGDGQLNTPVGVATDGTHVYVVDQGNDRIQKFTTGGIFVAKWGSSGTGDGHFTTPVGIAINPINGNVLVTDSGRDDVQEFTNTGVFVRKFAGSGSTDGLVSDPTGVIVTADGETVYIAEQGNDRVQQFDYDTSTEQLTAYPTLLGWNGVGWHPMWAADSFDYIPTWATVSAPVAGHYRLWWGMDDGNAYYLDLRRTFHNPRQGYLAGVDRFAETGYLLTSKFDASMLGFDKVASHVTVFADHASSDESITIEYAIDENGWEPLGSVTSVGRTDISFGDAGRVFNSIQFRVTLARGSTVTNTPVLKALTLLFVKIPQNARSMIFTIVPSSKDTGSYGNRNGQKMFTELDDLNDSREFFDVVYRGVTYEHCRIAGIRGHDNTADDGGQRTVSIIELPVGA
jgi:DNA-binding beta-propeller fold protein YncE